MRIPSKMVALALAALCCVSAPVLAAKPDKADGAQLDTAKTLAPVTQRYAGKLDEIHETPDFQKHVIPVMSRLGCNGRACHGSFQGRGGFQLSLFGYDFKADHEALFDEKSPRVDVEKPSRSLIVEKPTDEDNHEGGERYQLGSWEHHVIESWIKAGAKFDAGNIAKLTRLEVTPNELLPLKKGQRIQLTAVAVWADGTREDVTPLCRFHSNDDQVATIDQDGLVTCVGPGDTHVVAAYDKAVVPVPVILPVSEFSGDNYPDTPTPTKIDKLVVQKLRKLGVKQSELASDAEFLRRVRLDLTGTLPTAKEVETFLADESKDKRAKKIDALLETPEYAAWWTTRLCDWTGNNSDQLVNTSPMRNAPGGEWYQWIEHRVKNNTPYDELAAGIVLGQSRRPGQSYVEYCKEMSEFYAKGGDYADRPTLPYYWARRDFRQPEARAIGFAYTFLGIRIQCAQCHKHPFDQWSKNDFEQFQGFFNSVIASNTARPEDRKEYQSMLEDLGLNDKKINGGERRRRISTALEEGKTVPFPEVYVGSPRPIRNRNKNKKGNREPKLPTAKLLGAEVVTLTKDSDPREALMDWLRHEDNPYFARAFVNRVWANYFNVGIVDPPDDLSLANPPSNKPLLDYLTQGFVDNHYDMKWLHREIVNSRTYQLTWKPNETNRDDERNFSRAVPRRLPAEVAYDAIRQAMASDAQVEEVSETLDGRGIKIASSGQRYNRGQAYALTVFGRSTRESNCDCDRSEDASLLQTVYRQNDAEVLKMLDARKISWIDQVASENKLTNNASSSAGPTRKLPKNYREVMQSFQKRLKKLREQGDKKAVAALMKKAQAYRKRYGIAPPKAAGDDKPEKAEVNAEALATQAYLRTLSRYPSEQELARSVKHIEEAEDTLNGVRGLLWALVNTKEFIVNH